jgi:hypothetical protein
MAKTQITFEGLTGRTGSVEMPGGVSYCCPQCGSPLAEKGPCLAEFVYLPSNASVTGFVLAVSVNCRKCGCYGRAPAIKFC